MGRLPVRFLPADIFDAASCLRCNLVSTSVPYTLPKNRLWIGDRAEAVKRRDGRLHATTLALSVTYEYVK
jgi:hypothetical protein